MKKDYKEFFKTHKNPNLYEVIADFRLSQPGAFFSVSAYEDSATTYSLRKIYLSHIDDPTEVSFVDDAFQGNFEFWCRLKKSVIMRDTYSSWREEARQRYLAKNLRGIVSIAEDPDNKARFSALKYLCDTGFVTGEDKRKAGRPSKAEVEGAKQQILKEDKELAEAFDRLSIQ